MDFLVKRDDLHSCRFDDASPSAPEPGQALLEVDAFALTTNNITYAVMGDAMSYWSLFPAPEGWGRVPVWGFADVVASAHEGLPEGTRVYGYLPPSRHLMVVPDRVSEGGFLDAAPHRAQMAAIYNTYARVDGDPLYDPRREDQQMLLRPLFGTALLIDRHLADQNLFGARDVVISSASSKTSLGTAFLLSRREGIEVTGLTSASRVGFVEGVGVYDRVVAYEEVDSLPADEVAVYVDMSGDAEVRSAVHHRYGEALGHSLMVGVTHRDRLGGAPDDLPGPAPVFFFAPDAIPSDGGLGPQAGELMRAAFEWSAGWLRVVHGQGPEAVEQVYRELLDGAVDPSVGHILSLH